MRGALLALALLGAGPAWGETLRLAIFNTALSRDYAAHLIRDVERREAQVMGIAAILIETAPDIVLLTEFDHDPQGRAMAGLQAILAEGGLVLPHGFAGPVNTGEPTGRDMDGDGRLNEPEDAQSFARWPGHHGMALLSRHPLGAIRTFRTQLWAERPDARLSAQEITRFGDVQRLAARSIWDIEMALPGGAPLRLLAAHLHPPVFDGPEDLNGRRNADEMDWLRLYLGGAVERDDAGHSAPMGPGPVVLLAGLNADPFDGEALHDPLRALLAHIRLQDPAPASEGARLAGTGGANDAHRSPPEHDTADWADDPGPGNLRVDYVLPDAGLRVTGSGVFWPAPDAPFAEAVAASDHRLVWVDIALP